MTANLINGDCREVMAAMPENSIDSIVCDPPYGLSFMGKGWDHGVPGVEFWVEALRVAKPGAYLLAFGGTRTHHRLMVAIEDAGWEIRDMVMWVYGSGFPKSLDVSKAIDKAAGAEREVLGMSPNWRESKRDREKNGSMEVRGANAGQLTGLPITHSAKQWQGWGTALKPAWEPIIMARKPLVGTVAANVQQFGTGGLNIDGCRVGDFTNTTPSGVDRRNATLAEQGYRPNAYQMGETTPSGAPGRWPANLIHDGSDEVLECFPDARGQLADVSDTAPSDKTSNVYGAMARQGEPSSDNPNAGEFGFKMKPGARRLDSGSAARFFYCAKASKSDRDEGLDAFADKRCGMMEDDNYPIKTGSGNLRDTKRKNSHPTVKPTALMRYLCRLATPPGGTILDPFMGSGSTGKAALQEGFGFVGVDNDVEHGYFNIACARVKAFDFAPF